MNTSKHQPNKIKQLLFPESTNRLQYLVRTVIYLFLAALILGIEFHILTWLNIDPNKTAHEVIVLITLLAIVIYHIVGIFLPRIRYIGWKPLALLILLIPVVGIFFWFALFFIAPKKEQLTGDESAKNEPAVLREYHLEETRGSKSFEATYEEIVKGLKSGEIAGDRVVRKTVDGDYQWTTVAELCKKAGDKRP